MFAAHLFGVVAFLLYHRTAILSRSFFNLFSSFDLIRCDDFSSATFIVYHDFLSLSRTLFISFSNCFCHDRRSLSGNSLSISQLIHPVKNFFLPISSDFQSSGFVMTLSLSAKIEYHAFRQMSTHFLNLFEIFWRATHDPFKYPGIVVRVLPTHQFSRFTDRTAFL